MMLLTKCDCGTQVDTWTSKGEEKTGAGDQTEGDDAATSRLEGLVARREWCWSQDEGGNTIVADEADVRLRARKAQRQSESREREESYLIEREGREEKRSRELMKASKEMSSLFRCEERRRQTRENTRMMGDLCCC
jgi:hypothetical protein